MLVLLMVGILTLAIGYSSAFPYGSATHAYVAGRIGRIFPLMNSNETYGIMAPDLFNYAFELTANPVLYDYLWAHTHGFEGDESFLKVWEEAEWYGYQRNLGYGYVYHNDVWGMDYTAH